MQCKAGTENQYKHPTVYRVYAFQFHALTLSESYVDEVILTYLLTGIQSITCFIFRRMAAMLSCPETHFQSLFVEAKRIKIPKNTRTQIYFNTTSGFP